MKNESSIGQKIREISTHFLVYGLGSVAQSAIQFVLIPILTSSLAASEYGAYSLLQLASTVAGAIFYLGMTSALPKSYYDYADDQDRREVFTTAFLLLLTGAIAQVALAAFAGRELSILLLLSDKYRMGILWAFVASALAFTNQFLFTYLRFQRKSLTTIIISISALICSVGVSIYLLRIDGHDVSAPFKGTVVAQTGIMLVFLALYGRKAFVFRIKTREISLLLAFGLPTILTSAASMVIDWADRLLIEHFLSLKDVGIYSVGYKLGSVVNVLVVLPFAQIWNPMMLEYKEHANAAGFFKRVISYYAMVCAFLFIIVVIFAKDLLPIVARSGDYANLTPVITMVMLGYLLLGGANIVSAGLFYERKIAWFAVVYYCVAALNVSVNLFAIPRWGIEGAAGTTLLSYGLVPVLVYAISRRYYAFQFETWRLTRIGFVMVVAAFYGLYLRPTMQLPFYWGPVVFLLLLFVVAVLCTNRAERARLINPLRRKK